MIACASLGMDSGSTVDAFLVDTCFILPRRQELARCSAITCGFYRRPVVGAEHGKYRSKDPEARQGNHLDVFSRGSSSRGSRYLMCEALWPREKIKQDAI
jgi:hypothetical protein